MAHRCVARAAVAFALLGTLLQPVTATTAPYDIWDGMVMLQMPVSKKVTALSPTNHEEVDSLSEAGASDPSSLTDGNASKDMFDTTFFMYRLLGCMFLIISMSALISACFHGQLPLPWKLRSSKEMLDNPPEPGVKDSKLEKTGHSDADNCSEGTRGKEKTAEGEDGSPGGEAGDEKEVEAVGAVHEAVPPGTGMCCCTAGIAKLVKTPPGVTPHKDACDEQATNTESSSFPPLNGLPLTDSHVPFSAPLPPPSCMKSGHPDFSGTWACVKAEGELDELMADFGLGYLIRSAASAYSYGAGHVSRICEHEGSRVKYQETGFDGLNTYEYDVPSEDVCMTSHLRTVYWDEVQPHVLVVEGKDLQKAKPSTWSTSWQYFVDENTFYIKSRSRADHVATWIYKREMA